MKILFLLSAVFGLVECWTPWSWQQLPIKQNPEYPNVKKLTRLKDELKKKPPLVFVGEIEKLKSHLADIYNSKQGFILQAGDCAENMDESIEVDRIRRFVTLMTQLSLIIQYGSEKKVLRIGRIAGQYAKPRSEVYEKDNRTLTFRGHLIHGMDNRTPEPFRLKSAYEHSLSTLNTMRSFLLGGGLCLETIDEWITPITKESHSYYRFHNFNKEIKKMIHFVRGINMPMTDFYSPEFYTSHEALLLHYEEVFVKKENKTGKYYHCGAHTVWLGERTRDSDAHIEFLSGIENPIGIKIGPTTNTTKLIELLYRLNPKKERGKIMLIARLGTKNVQEALPRILHDLQGNDTPPYLFMCDPCHGNTISVDGVKTRLLKDILYEIYWFFYISLHHSVYPAGIHLELTPDQVTECISSNVSAKDLMMNYQSLVDPRLNNRQSIETAFYIANLFEDLK